MKQHITLKQWNELSDEQKLAFSLDREIYVQTWRGSEEGFVAEKYVEISIGQMIEFLGDEWMTKCYWYSIEDFVSNDKLCDALWEAVKQKL